MDVVSDLQLTAPASLLSAEAPSLNRAEVYLIIREKISIKLGSPSKHERGVFRRGWSGGEHPIALSSLQQNKRSISPHKIRCNAEE